MIRESFISTKIQNFDSLYDHPAILYFYCKIINIYLDKKLKKNVKYPKVVDNDQFVKKSFFFSIIL